MTIVWEAICIKDWIFETKFSFITKLIISFAQETCQTTLSEYLEAQSLLREINKKSTVVLFR